MIGITGGNGVLGKILQNKYKNTLQSVCVFHGDITDKNSVNEWILNNPITDIIHLASKVAVKDVQNNLPAAYEVNVLGTINLINAIDIKQNKVNFFYASSSHVYKSAAHPLKETDIIEPINSYGLTKFASELLLNDYRKSNPKINLCIGRIFSFYHDTQKSPFLYPNLMARFQNENLDEPFKLFGALSTRDFLNAEQVCDIIIQLVEKQCSATVNIASGTSISIMDFVQQIAPQKLILQYDEAEMQNHLNADINLLNKILHNE